MTSDPLVHTLSPSKFNLTSAPLMGGASGLGLGLALACPDRGVWIIDGDGSLLMELGILATIAAQQPPNLFQFVLKNGVWFEGSANLPLPARNSLSFTEMARATGYRVVASFTSVGELRKGLDRLLGEPGPALIELVVEPESTNMWSRTNPQPELPDDDLFERMGRETREIRDALASGND